MENKIEELPGSHEMILKHLDWAIHHSKELALKTGDTYYTAATLKLTQMKNEIVSRY